MATTRQKIMALGVVSVVPVLVGLFGAIEVQAWAPGRLPVPCTAAPSSSSLHAKKGKKGKNKKGGKNKNQNSGFAWASSFTLKPFEAQALRDLTSTALASFEGRTGKPLAAEVSGVADPPKALWNAPIACVIVAPLEDNAVSSNDEDPPVISSSAAAGGANLQYANLAALEMMGLQAGDFERLCPASAAITGKKDAIDPSTIVTMDLPNEMKGDKKYQKGYEKKVVRQTDNENSNDITILNAHRWALEKSALVGGKFVTTTLGVAYAWEEWLVGESTVCSAGGNQRVLVNLSDLEAQLEQQAAFIRQLKEEQGLGNKDPQVVQAVEKLLKLKDQIAAATA